MNHLKNTLIFALLVISTSSLSTRATTFNITNNCPYTVWAAAVPGGGTRLNPGGTWTITPAPGTAEARIWARTGCTVTGPNGLRCRTGDCGGLLKCTAHGSAPNTLGEYALDQFSKMDIFDISLVDGFNVPMGFVPMSNGCKNGPICRADVNGLCPSVLRAQGGCNDPCSVFKSDKYCCYSGNCGPTNYSNFFKKLCPNAFSYPNDYRATTFTCSTGTNYRVTFCP